MSLIGFHKFLIATAILFCVGFSFRQWSEFQATGDRGTLVMAMALGLAAVAFGYYLAHLRDFLRIRSGREGPGASLKSDPSSMTHHFLQPSDSRDTESVDELPLRSGNGGNRLRTWAMSLIHLGQPPVKDNEPDGRARKA